jgi:hypothetical protein
VVLGKGLPLFSELAAPTPLKLMSSKAFPGGAPSRSFTARRESVAKDPVAGHDGTGSPRTALALVSGSPTRARRPQMQTRVSTLAVVRACLQAYVQKDRAALEALLDEDYHFTSPLDNSLDRASP